MRIVFVGPPGAGKGTQSVRLARHLQVPHLSTGEMFREACQQQSDVGKKASSYMESGRLVPDKLVESIAFGRLVHSDCESGYVLDGFPRTRPQAVSFDQWLEHRQQALSGIIEIQVTEDELFRRLDGRGRDDDARYIAAERFDQYRTLTSPLLDYYREQNRLQIVNGLGTTDEVFARIQCAIENFVTKN